MGPGFQPAGDSGWSCPVRTGQWQGFPWETWGEGSLPSPGTCVPDPCLLETCGRPASGSPPIRKGSVPTAQPRLAAGSAACGFGARGGAGGRFWGLASWAAVIPSQTRPVSPRRDELSAVSLGLRPRGLVGGESV